MKFVFRIKRIEKAQIRKIVIETVQTGKTETVVSTATRAKTAAGSRVGTESLVETGRTRSHQIGRMPKRKTPLSVEMIGVKGRGEVTGKGRRRLQRLTGFQTRYLSSLWFQWREDC